MRLFLIMIFGVAILTSCNNNNAAKVVSSSTTSEVSNSHHIIVKEFLQTSSYTYVLAEENDQDYWIAVSKINIEVGDNIYYKDAMEMKDFKSKELDRVFEHILFIQTISTEPMKSDNATAMGGHGMPKPKTIKTNIKVEPVSGSITIAELFKNRDKYDGKKVLVRGQVVKVNNEIMNRNWIHLQDGTNDSGNFDLTITTEENVTTGDILTFEGTVVLNKDFGAGYSYELIVEKGSLK